MTKFHSDLYPVVRFIPPITYSPFVVRLLNILARLGGAPKLPAVEGVTVEDVLVLGLDGAPAVRVRLYRPKNAPGPVPAMLWIHGGGFVIGTPEIDEDNNIANVRELGIAVAAVDYRLAPEHPFPAAIEDCYAGLRWLCAESDRLGIRPDRIAIGGASSGGGLAAGLTLMAYDRKEVPVAFQLLIYPMLDDRTVLRTDIDHSKLRMWNTKSNGYSWTAYLKKTPGAINVDPYAAPARRESLSGLPPAWVGVGTFDLFHDEDLAYAKRLMDAGIPCEVHIVPGAYHGFDRMRKAKVVRQFRDSYLSALKRALFPALI